MRVSTKYPVAVHAMLMIAGLSGKMKVNSEMIAKSTGVNAVVIRKIFQSLKQASLIQGSPGPGGTTLAQSPESITLWDIFKAIESGNTDDIFAFHQHPAETCPVGGSIYDLLKSHFDDAIGAMKSELSRVTIAMLLSELFGLEPELPLIAEK